MTSPESLKAALIPLAKLVSELDLSDPTGAINVLNERANPSSLKAVTQHLLDAHSAGWLTPKRATPTLTFGRISKALKETWNQSIDVVDIVGAGAEHTHPKGEVSFCLELEGAPKFDGHGAGWVVYGPDSHHTPTVTGGRMLIVYFQPDGAIKWGPREG
jgi:hypothetical protein